MKYTVLYFQLVFQGPYSTFQIFICVLLYFFYLKASNSFLLIVQVDSLSASIRQLEMERDQLADILHRTQDQQDDDFQRLQQHLELQLKQQLQQQYRQVHFILRREDFIKSDYKFSTRFKTLKVLVIFFLP